MLDYWMAFGAGLAWLLGTGHGLSHHRPALRHLLGLLFFAIGFIQVVWLGVYQGWIQYWPGLLYLHQPALFLIGPCLWLYSFALRHPYRPLTPHCIRHFALAAMVTIISLLQWMLHDEEGMLRLSPLLVAAAAGSGGFYILPLARRLARVQDQASYLRVELRVLRCLMAIGFGVALAALFFDLLRSDTFYQVYLSVITLVMVASYLLGVRYPELSHYIADRMETAEHLEKARYERSTLTRVDVDKVLRELDRLMDEEAVYCDDSLTLAGLAERLNIRAHQLSEILNEKLKHSFPAYLKARRVEAARHLLLSEPDETILAIGMRVGFNSSSAFYAAFRDITGMPPGQFRKQNN